MTIGVLVGARQKLNGYSSEDEVQDVSKENLRGLGSNLSNWNYIKQVKKRYLKKGNDPSTNNNFSQDYLWFLAASEIGSFDNERENTIFTANAAYEGDIYMWYQSIPRSYNDFITWVRNNRVKYSNTR